MGIERMQLFRAAALVAGAALLLVHAAVSLRMSPSAVLDGYEVAWGQHDADAALAQFDDNAVVTFYDSRSRSMRTRQQIGDFLRTTELHGPPLLTTSRQIQGNIVSWSEHLEDQLPDGTDLTVQAVVANGKIQSLVYRPGKLIRTPDGPGVDAPNIDPQLAVTVLGAIVLLGLGLLSLASAPRRVNSVSNLHGRLLRDLKLWQSGSPALL